MTGPTRNSEFSFPSSLSVPITFIERLGETKLTVSLGTSHFKVIYKVISSKPLSK